MRTSWTLPQTVHVFYLSDVAGFDGTLVLTLDFAGNPDTDFEISNIVIKKHSDDDGTVLPSEPDEPEAPVTWVDVNSEDNMFFGCEYTTNFTMPRMGADCRP